jgi:hypothetical protein
LGLRPILVKMSASTIAKRDDSKTPFGHNIELSCRPARSHALTVLPNPTDSCRGAQADNSNDWLCAARALRAAGQKPAVNVLIFLVLCMKARSEPSNIVFFHKFLFRAPINNLIQTRFLHAHNIEFSCPAARSHPLQVLRPMLALPT